MGSNPVSSRSLKNRSVLRSLKDAVIWVISQHQRDGPFAQYVAGRGGEVPAPGRPRPRETCDGPRGGHATIGWAVDSPRVKGDSGLLPAPRRVWVSWHPQDALTRAGARVTPTVITALTGHRVLSYPPCTSFAQGCPRVEFAFSVLHRGRHRDKGNSRASQPRLNQASRKLMRARCLL